MTLGLTDSTINYGLMSENNIGAGVLETAYGINVGVAAVGATAVNKTLGITTDPTKSGVISTLTADENIKCIIKY